MSKHISFLVTLDLPDGVTPAELAEYIDDAVCSWCKGQDPEDPIFDLDRESVNVALVKEPQP